MLAYNICNHKILKSVIVKIFCTIFSRKYTNKEYSIQFKSTPGCKQKSIVLCLPLPIINRSVSSSIILTTATTKPQYNNTWLVMIATK